MCTLFLSTQVRCIKPNNLKYPGGFNAVKILEQLRYCGVLETVRIRREGFPVRVAFAEFLAKPVCSVYS